ncbi:MAG: extracellular solute-binding protein [Holosporales bacterium]|jgi:putrescine transport system substrate-binding protein|nr:extracellular solute-binding protein [Holosporales bacterium]
MASKLKPYIIWFFVISVAISFMFLINSRRESRENREIISVYTLFRVIPPEVIKNFEKETGIKVIYDTGDDNDILEAKLLAANNEYDIICPSFIPYAARQVLMGVYTNLELDLLPNIKNIEGIITDQFKKTGGNTNYLIPLFWGTTGIVFESSIIDRIFPNEKIDSYDILFNEEKVKKLKEYGVSFPQELIDIFPQIKAYLKIDSKLKDIKSVKLCFNALKQIRKYVTKFASDGVVNDLLSGEICVAIVSSDIAARAIMLGESINKKIKYILPKECPVLWIDCMAIPKGSKNKKNAHKFLNYLMTSTVAAKITNSLGILTNIPEATKHFDEKIKVNDNICPLDPELLKKLIIGAPAKTKTDLKFERKFNRAWARIKASLSSAQDEDEI